MTAPDPVRDLVAALAELVAPSTSQEHAEHVARNTLELVQARRQLAAVRATVDRYAITDDDAPTDWQGHPRPVVEYTEPEDVWRLFRDLRAALTTQPAPTEAT